MNRIPNSYEGVALVAPVTTGYMRYSDHGAMWFIGRTLAELLTRAGLHKGDVDGLAVTSFSLHPDTVASVAEHLGLELGWAEQIPLGGAAGIIAARRAARAIQAGDAEIIACIGADTFQKGSFKQLVSGFSRFSAEAAYPYGAAGPNTVFALIARNYMNEYGATREDFGRICVAQRQNARDFPHALLRDPMTIAQYLAAPPVAEPFHLYDCVMPCAGGEGFLVMSEDRARALRLPYAHMLAAAERHNSFSDAPIQARGGWRIDREALYDAAGFGPEDVDVVETYDDYAVISMMQLEELGFCEEGEAARFVARTDLTYAGTLPHNTSGGQLSCGQAGAAGGYLGIVEALRQVTGQALGQQVTGARHAVVSGFGMVNYDRGLCSSAAILGGAKC